MTQLSPTKEKLVRFLQGTGPVNTLTSRAARARFGVKNLRARVAELRAAGYPIYTNYKKVSKGRYVASYRLGRASKTTRFSKLLNAGFRTAAIRSLYRR